MRLLIVGWLVVCAAMVSGEPQVLIRQDFDALPAGPLAEAGLGWAVTTESQTSVEVRPMPDRGQALRLLDDRRAEADASCTVRIPVPGVTGRWRLSVAMMLCQGVAGAVHQDSGMRLYTNAQKSLQSLFFSGNQLRTWFGSGWLGLDPPARWTDGRWYTVVLTGWPRADRLRVSIDGTLRDDVTTLSSGPLAELHLASQRYAQGELWFDDLVIETLE